MTAARRPPLKAGARAARDVRRRALLDRIAAERVELQVDLARVREAASVSRIVRQAIAPTLIGRWLGAAPHGARSDAGRSGWWLLALRGWRGWRRVAPLAALVGAFVRPRAGSRAGSGAPLSIPLLGPLLGSFRRGGAQGSSARTLLPGAAAPRRVGWLVSAGRRLRSAFGALLSRRRG